jgi:glycosyltransferase involved in cell wall biosynthesis
VALFVTPISYKGLETVLMLARARPDAEFAFVAGGRITPGELSALRNETDRLGNVEVRAASRDPAAIYGDARAVLVPSVHPEAWGRVVTEAQMSAIPALASAVGGLPDSVGAGGLLVPPEAGDEGWRAAFAELWDDEEAYGHYAEAAERESRRTDVTPEAVGDRFERLLRGLSA